MVIAPIYIGMCMLLSWFAGRLAGRERRSPRIEGTPVTVTPPPEI